MADSNPLEKIFPVETRETGLYIKVTKEQRDGTDIKYLKQVLDNSKVVNYQLDVIEKVIKKASSQFEYIGPEFEYYNSRFDSFVDVEIKKLEAKAKISSNSIAEGIKPTPEKIAYCLENVKGVRYGMDYEAIEAIVKNATYDEYVKVAKGKPPRKGRDGYIDPKVDVVPDRRPTISETGKADYREIDTFTAVSKGDVVAVRVPPEPGEPGISIKNEKIPAEPGSDIKLPAGKNTEVSKDGRSLCATVDGVVYRKDGIYNVIEKLIIQKDVDFSVGNIKYTGDIEIGGTIKPGFKVETEGNVIIGGEVEDGIVISRNGSVVIKKGILGKSKAYVYADKGISLGFAQKAKIRTDGDLYVGKSLMHCDSQCSRFLPDNENADILGGKLVAFKKVSVTNLGNSSNTPTNIYITDKERFKMEEKEKELNRIRGEIVKTHQKVEKELKAKSQIFKQAGDAVTMKQKQELKKWIDNYNNLGKKIKYVDTKLEEIKNHKNDPKNLDGIVECKGNIFPGVVIDFYGIDSKVIKDSMKYHKYWLNDERELETGDLDDE